MQAEIVRGTDINKFGLAMKLAGLDLPISHDRANVGTLLDSNGNGFAVVDVNRELSDATVTDIAELIVLAVNGRAGTRSGDDMEVTAAQYNNALGLLSQARAEIAQLQLQLSRQSRPETRP